MKNVAWVGGIHLGQLAAVKCLLFTVWMGTTCAPYIVTASTALAPGLPGRQHSLMALLISEGVESKPPSVFFFSPRRTPVRANPHEHKKPPSFCVWGRKLQWVGLQNPDGCAVRLTRATVSRG